MITQSPHKLQRCQLPTQTTGPTSSSPPSKLHLAVLLNNAQVQMFEQCSSVSYDYIELWKINIRSVCLLFNTNGIYQSKESILPKECTQAQHQLSQWEAFH
jgi:hypothetical protein